MSFVGPLLTSQSNLSFKLCFPFTVTKATQDIDYPIRPPTQKNKLDAMLQSDMSKAAFDTLRYNRTLEQMQERYTALLAKLELIQPLKQAAEPGTTSMAILEWMEILTLDKMQRCSPVKQAAVQYRLLQCEAQKKCVNAMLPKLRKIK